jgi:hypothetical protein
MKRVRFYDDNQDYLKLHPNLERVVETIWVPRDPILDRQGRVIVTGRAYNDFIRSEGGWDLNGSDRDLSDLLTDLSKEEEKIILSTGINESHIRDLKRFARELPPVSNGRTKGVVIFDWDEVLNRREGYRRAGGNHSPTAYMKYAMGTKARMRQIKLCIELLSRNKIEVHVATNNTGCGKSAFFESIAHALHPSIRVHCCRKYDTKSECISVEKMIPPEIISGFGRTRSSRSGRMKQFRNVTEN